MNQYQIKWYYYITADAIFNYYSEQLLSVAKYNNKQVRYIAIIEYNNVLRKS